MNFKVGLGALVIVIAGRFANAQTAAIISFPQITPATQVMTPERVKAKKILERLVGIKVPSNLPLLLKMETLVRNGDLAGATQLATTHPMFYNLTVKQMAAEMSTRNLSKKEKLNDFAAMLIGITRDETDGRGFLMGNFQYLPAANTLVVDLRASPAGYKTLPLSYFPAADEATTNDYYYYGYPHAAFRQFQADKLDMSQVLVRSEGQVQTTLLTRDPSIVAPKYEDWTQLTYTTPVKDAAGAMTTVTFLKEMAGDGRNRRMIQYGFSEFLCAPISEWADASQPDTHVPRDISRFPAGNHSIYLNTCKGCHSVMDGMKAAFNRIQTSSASDPMIYNLNVSSVFENHGPAENPSIPGVIRKVNDVVIFPYGNIVTDTQWTNYATSEFHQKYFGWRGQTTGSSINELAVMMANSMRYRNCMAARVVKNVCIRNLNEATTRQMVEEQGQQFEQNGYNFKKLFQSVAQDARCL